MEKNNKIRKYIKGYLFILPNFIGFFVFMALPIIMGLVISFTDYNGFSQFNFVGLKNYIDMFHDEYFTVSLKNNLVYTLVTVPGTIVFALLLAVGVNKGIKGSSLFKTMFFLPNISSMVAVGIVWAMIFNQTQGPLNQVLMALGVANPPQWLSATKTALGSVSLFTDTDLCKQILCRIKEWLSPMGKFVFAVDTIANRCTDDNDYAIAVSVKTKENFELVLK